MKHSGLLMALLFMASSAFTQISIPQTDATKKAASAISDFIKPPAIGDVGKTTSGIVDMLMKDLSIGSAKKPQLTDAISGFLKSKQGIMGLANTNPTEYLNKFNPLQSGLFGKMKGIMGAAAFTKFLGMKPSGSNIAGNLLSNLFF